MSTKRSLTRQQFSMIISILLQGLYESPAASLSSPVSESQSSIITVPIQRLPLCNRLLVCCANSKTSQLLWCDKTIFLRIFTNFKHESHEFSIYGPDHASKVIGFWPMDRVEIDAYVCIPCRGRP